MSYIYELIFGVTEPVIEPSIEQIRQRHLVLRQIEKTDVKTFLFRTSRLRKNKKYKNSSLTQFILNKNKFNILTTNK